VRAVETFTDRDGIEVSYRRWLPTGTPKALVVLAHGASEHSGRYDRFATFLTGRGYAVVAPDHRGHGETAKATGVGIGGERGWVGMIDDLHELRDLALTELGDLPVILLGHSMGSFLAQRYIQLYGDGLAGVVLSGSSGGLADLDASIEGLQAFVDAGAAEEPAPIFGPLNAPFEPARTPFDWLSRDEAEVDKYVADPMCGDSAPLTIGFVLDMMRNGATTWDPANEKLVREDLPVLLVTGEEDPVSEGGRTVRELEARLRANGVADVTGLYYAGARHELLNETNRDAVSDDIVAWLDRVVS
jgi:alpha-beta hydrolase superfamily lysophospholipase